ncbi:MAG: hypothetical protein K9N47_09455 [Prosthecobacter sp.]|uniref:hypothetical protein n=1 Tax=Prosthecobacter sp. TaxID=1965333 RepID=UPI0025F63A9D|nr:hypothetical protein [Prosthecobacter sp.]MCF7786338.1 hypothetical protein [Prosthecobacter sp.]
MKLIITFVLGALTGAFLLWFGFSKVILTLNNSTLVEVDRFTGKASQVFVSLLERELASEKEFARLDELRKNAVQEAQPAPVKPAVVQPEWRDLNESEIKQLDFKWHVNGTTIKLDYHNPFEKDVRIDKVRVQIPAKEGHIAIDREYEVGMHSICPPLADLEADLKSLKLPTSEFYEMVAEKKPQVSGSDPFGTAGSPGQKNVRSLVGTITPVRVLIRN